MPLHVYYCDECNNKFEQLRPFGGSVSRSSCPSCAKMCAKSWLPEDGPAMPEPDFTPYYNEQLGEHIGSRCDLKRAMHRINVNSDGVIKPEWH